MVKPRVLILRSPGTNCDAETSYAFERAGGQTEDMHINRLLEAPERLNEFQILCLPGGFSYGDDIAAGRILGNQIRHGLARCLGEFKAAGKLVLGICNGFQVLIKSGILLPLDSESLPPATLTWNSSGRFEARWVPLHVASGKSIFFEGIDAMYLPVAHAEGKFVPRTEGVLEQLRETGQLVLRYGDRPSAGVDRADSPPGITARAGYPDNPNGSSGDVAGVCDDTGRVCGFMPHPERYIDRLQHPRWSRQQLAPDGDGLRVFRNAVNYFQ